MATLDLSETSWRERYEAVTQLEETPVGHLHRALDRRRGRPVDLHSIEPPWCEVPGFLHYLSLERPAALALREPTAARVVDVDAYRDRVLIATEPRRGYPLGQLLRQAELRGRPLPIRFVLHLALEVGQLLQQLEQTPWREGGDGMGHGRLDPTAVGVDEAGDVHVSAVGLARAWVHLPPSREALAWRPPQPFTPLTLGPRVDVYGLGMLLFDALFGRQVFLRSTLEATQEAVVRGIRPRLTSVRADVDEPLEAVIEWMLAPQPEKRPSAIREIMGLLAGVLERLSEGSSARRHAAAWVTQLIPEGGAEPSFGAVEEASDGGNEVPDDVPILAPPPSSDLSLETVEAYPMLPGPSSSSEQMSLELTFEAPIELEPDAVEPAFTPLALDPRSETGAPDAELEFSPLESERVSLYEGFDLEDMVTDDAELDFVERYQRSGSVPIGDWLPAQDLLEDQAVSLERVPPGPPERFARRHEEVQRVPPHDALLRFHEARFDESEGAMFVVTDRVNGEPLSERVARDGSLATVELHRLFEQVSGALDHLHRHGVVHGGLNPDAIAVQGSGPQLRCQVGGLFDSLGSVELADPVFLSPERAEGREPSTCGDVWTLGALMFFAACGEGPFSVMSRSSLVGELRVETPPRLSERRPGVRRLDIIVMTALTVDDRVRPRDVRSLLAMIDAPAER